MAHADRALPQSGLIVDAGAGTGNFSSYLARSQDGRRMLSFEQADDGLAQTAEKLRAILGDRAGRHVQTRGSLLEVDSISGGVGADGYVLNNVLYTLGDDGERVFTSLARDLKPGGIMYLNDPMSFVTREGFIEQFITDLAVDAWKRGAPMTGHDIALIAAVNSGRLVRSSGGATPIFRTPAQLRELAARAGLEVVEEGTAYLSSTYTLILRRP